MQDSSNQQLMIQNLLRQAPGAFTVVETHISTLLLGGEYAYKIKKPVDFGFLNFSTLQLRRHFCEEEIRLNGRLAPSIYLEVVPITGSTAAPALGGTGTAIEFAVKMRRFDDSGLLTKLLARGDLDGPLIDDLADQIAAFHQQIPATSPDTTFGQPDAVLQPMLENFAQIRAIVTAEAPVQQLQLLEHWTHKEFQRLRPRLQQRRAQGFIRECHGDMHLGNIVLSEGKLIIFDGIEFNDNLRWIDVISELAFITMDLTEQGAAAFASRLLNSYLEQTGDYEGLSLLRFYQVYRAMVRAKVTTLSLPDRTQASRIHSRQMQTFRDYLALAERFTQRPRNTLLVMAGYSASGKSRVSRLLLEQLDLIRLRSDRERKRLFAQTGPATAAVNQGIYNPQATQQTYQRLFELAEQLLATGFSVVVDATFLKRAQREPFQMLAQRMHCDYRVIWLDASIATLIERMARRWQDKGNISDATEAVIRRQQQDAEIPGADEAVIRVNSDQPLDARRIIVSLGL